LPHQIHKEHWSFTLPDYRRVIIPGGTFFFTLITFERKPILTSELARGVLHSAFQNTKGRYLFQLPAICLLPDHLHCIMNLPTGDIDYSKRWSSIKGLFTINYIKAGGEDGSRNNSRIKKGEAAIWQRRYWEHTIRDEKDYERHFDYIHYNPIKHGLVSKPSDWLYSSFHKYLKLGYYDQDWGCIEPKDFDKIENYGE
jgi:putative transposase